MLVLLASLLTAAWAETGVVTTTPVIVEANEEPAAAAAPLSAPVPLQAGVGMKNPDVPRNELGIELQSMERLEEISVDRREDAWFLRLGPGPRARVHGDLGKDERLKAELRQALNSELDFRAEAGGRRDHRSVPFIDSAGTPFTSSDDSRSSYDKRDDSAFLKLGLQAERFELQGDFDSRFADTRAGPLLTGRKTQRQTMLSGRVGQQTKLLPFLQYRAESFDSELSPLLSTRTHGLRAGVQSEVPLGSARWTLSPAASYEGLGRTRAQGARADYRRLAARAQLNSGLYDLPGLELSAHLRIEHDSDSIAGAPSGVSDTLWDVGAELSSSHANTLGARARLRRFAQVPTPSQRFGDGGLLDGSTTLPPETGFRVAVGPWLQKDGFQASLEGFYEEAHDTPVLIATSPQSARTLPLGAVWSRGLELKLGATLGRWALTESVTRQEALNASEINWQQGQAIPGRPDWVSESELSFKAGGFHAGSRFSYRSSDALDLGGLWSKPPEKRLDFYLGYGKKSWEARLEATRLLFQNDPPGAQGFEGTAGPNLLEPEQVETEWKLRWEVAL